MTNYKKINLDDFEEFGAGSTAASYNSKANADIMLKLYFPGIDLSIPEREKALSDTVISLGIPTAPALELVECSGRTGVIFRRLSGKKSISRLIADSPADMEKYVKIFAMQGKILHSTPASSQALPSCGSRFKDIAAAADFLSDNDKQKIFGFIDRIKPSNTCIHGDMGPTNLVIAANKAYWIDVADFSFGDPFFDLGLLYAIMFCIDPERTLKNQHLTKAQTARFWDYFVKAYLSYDIQTGSFKEVPDKENISAFTHKASLFSMFGALFFYSHIGITPWIQKIFDNTLPLI